MIDKRMIEIIKKLFESSYISKEDLIKSCSLTKRQLDYSLEKLNDWLKDHQVEPIGFINNYAIIQPKTYDFLLASMRTSENQGTEGYILSTQERIKYIFLLLIIKEGELSINYFTAVLAVSKSTLVKDLKGLERELLSYDLKIEYSRKRGYYLSGNEGEIRFFLMKLVMTCVSSEGNQHFLDLFIEENQLVPFNEIAVKVLRLTEKYQLAFAENRLLEFIYTLILLKQRLLQYPDYLPKKVKLSKLSKTPEYLFSSDLVKELDILSNDVIMYLCTWLLGVSEVNIDKADENFNVILVAVEELLVRFEFLSGIVFEDREEVKMQILRHFRSVHYRLMFKLPIVNSLCDRVKEEYEALYIIVKEAVKDYEYQFQIKIPDDEVAFLVMHFVSLINHFKEEQERQMAVVVCPNGIGSSMMIYTQLKTLFPQFIFLKPMALMDVNKLKVDVIFSTTPNPLLLEMGKPLFIVNPLMTPDEKNHLIRNVYMEISHSSVKLPNINQIIGIIEKYVGVKERKEIEKELFKTMVETKSVLDRSPQKPLLHEIICESFIQLNVDAKNSFEAVTIASKPLLDAKMITKQYVDKMLEILEINSKYMVISKGVALPHAKVEYGAKQLAMGITVLKEPVCFNHQQNDPVKYIFCLSAIDKERHLQALSTLVNLLAQPNFYECLNQGKTPAEIRHFIEQWETLNK